AVPLFVQMRAGKRDEAFSAASRTSDPVTLPRDHFAVETGTSQPLVTLPPTVVVEPVVML
ncbi:hypothetical protein, partial [Pseudomonas lactis]|uniref:hypothetical protein n=1 Tax=Pseudomonas lactis TaxID=1615674 RepID=UPI003F80F8FE